MSNKNLVILLIIVVLLLAGLGVYYVRSKSGGQYVASQDSSAATSQQSADQTVQATTAPASAATTTPSAPKNSTDTTTMANGLQITIEKPGSGAAAKAGDKVTVNYVGTLTDGTKFDSSYDRNQPFVFTLGAGEVIQGWDQGVVGMKVGEKRKLVIPAALGYGAQSAGSIPPNSTLIFEVDMVKIN